MNKAEEFTMIHILDMEYGDELICGVFRTIEACFLWLHLFEMSLKKELDYKLEKVEVIGK